MSLRLTDGDEFQAARSLILKNGWNTTCYQILNPGILRWHDVDSVIGFVEHFGRRIVAGAPVCRESHLGDVLKCFEGSSKKSVCYFGAEGRLFQHSRSSGRYSHTILGAQPVWEPANWIRSVSSDASLRAQLNRAKNKGVVVSEWVTDRALQNPILTGLLQEWLSTRGMPEMHFLVEPDTLGFLDDRRVFVAEQDGIPIAFTVLCPIPVRNGWLTEQFVRGRHAVNGTVELMLDTAIRTVEHEGASMVTMGMVPLSRQVPRSPADPAWLRFTMNWVKAHGQRFYSFDGLEWFKNKFRPDRWDPIYAVSTESHISPGTLYGIASAFTRTAPWLAISRGMLRAIRQEATWIRKAMSEPRPN